jgi:hypothetical protein
MAKGVTVLTLGKERAISVRADGSSASIRREPSGTLRPLESDLPNV